MSLLKRLTEQALERREGAGTARSEADLRRANYDQITLPAVQALEAYLRELVSHLKVVRPQLKQTFELSGYGVFFAIPSPDWAIATGEPMSSSHTITLSWKSRVDTESAPRQNLPSYDRVRTLSEIFKRFHLGGIREEKRNSSGQVCQASAQATGVIACKLVITAHVEEPNVSFAFENVDQLASVRRSLPANVLGPDVFDRLGEFMLRENDLFVREQWVRGLEVFEREVVIPEPQQTVSLQSKTMSDAAEQFEKPEPTAEELAATAHAQVQARDRELDFLAELKMASRYAEQAVQKNIEFSGSGEFGSERDLASLKIRFDDAPATPAAIKPTPVTAKAPTLIPVLPKPAPVLVAAPAAINPPAPVVIKPLPLPAQTPISAPKPVEVAVEKPKATLSVTSKALEELAKTLSPEAAAKFRERLEQFKSRS
jgi:hypothetical protein